jgi:hypothetical protein
MVVSKTVSTNGRYMTFAGTYAEVINALDEEGIPAHKVLGFVFSSAGDCVALVNKH